MAQRIASRRGRRQELTEEGGGNGCSVSSLCLCIRFWPTSRRRAPSSIAENDVCGVAPKPPADPPASLPSPPLSPPPGAPALPPPPPPPFFLSSHPSSLSRNLVSLFGPSLVHSLTTSCKRKTNKALLLLFSLPYFRSTSTIILLLTLELFSHLSALSLLCLSLRHKYLTRR